MSESIIIIIASLLMLIPLLPAKYVYNPDFFIDNLGNKLQRGRVSLLLFFLHQVMILLQETLIGMAIALGLKGSVTILIFLVVGVDLFYKRGLSSQGLIISVIGVIALYLDQLVANASELDFFKGLFHYKSK